MPLNDLTNVAFKVCAKTLPADLQATIRQSFKSKDWDSVIDAFGDAFAEQYRRADGKGDPEWRRRRESEDLNNARPVQVRYISMAPSEAEQKAAFRRRQDAERAAQVVARTRPLEVLDFTQPTRSA
jgi:hypothetical protein